MKKRAQTFSATKIDGIRGTEILAEKKVGGCKEAFPAKYPPKEAQSPES